MIRFLKVLHAQEKAGNQECKDKSEIQMGSKNSTLLVKAKQKDRKYALLKRLMLFGLKPSLRMAALKMLMCKKKKLVLCDLNGDDLEGKISFPYLLLVKCIFFR